MPANITLYDAVDSILDAVVDRLNNERERTLSSVQSVIRGDRARPHPAEPTLWVFSETMQPDHIKRAIAETWTLPVVISPIVRSDDPEGGYREATRLAAQARSAVLKGHDLGLRTFVQDVKSGRFEPSAPWHRKEQLYSAVAVVIVTFTVYEE